MIPHRQPADLFTPRPRVIDGTIDALIASAVADHAAGRLPKGWTTEPLALSGPPWWMVTIGAALFVSGAFGLWFGASL